MELGGDSVRPELEPETEPEMEPAGSSGLNMEPAARCGDRGGAKTEAGAGAAAEIVAADGREPRFCLIWAIL